MLTVLQAVLPKIKSLGYNTVQAHSSAAARCRAVLAVLPAPASQFVAVAEHSDYASAGRVLGKRSSWALGPRQIAAFRSWRSAGDQLLRTLQPFRYAGRVQGLPSSVQRSFRFVYPVCRS